MKNLLLLALSLSSLSAFSQAINVNLELPALGEPIQAEHLPGVKEALNDFFDRYYFNSCKVIAKSGDFTLEPGRYTDSRFTWNTGYNNEAAIVVSYKAADINYFFAYITDATDTKVLGIKYKMFRRTNEIRVNEGTLSRPRFVMKSEWYVDADGYCAL